MINVLKINCGLLPDTDPQLSNDPDTDPLLINEHDT